MAPKSAAGIILLAILSVVVVSVAGASKLGEWQRIDHPNAVKEVVDAALFAVDEYGRHHAVGKFVSVVKAQSRMVNGIEYQIVISTKNYQLIFQNYVVDVLYSVEKGQQLIYFRKAP